MPDQDPEDEVGDQILDAALKCFEEVGIRRTSMDDIARAAGVGRMTVFRRFKGKDQLTHIVLLRIGVELTELARAAFADAGDLETGLTEALTLSVQALRDRPLFVKILRTEPEAFLRSLTTDGMSIIEGIRRSFGGWLGVSGGGPLNDEDAELVAEGITRLGVSLVLSPDGPIPLHDDQGLRKYLSRYVVPGITRLATE